MIEEKKTSQSRRQFLRNTTVTLGSALAFPTIINSKALAGIGGRGGVPASDRIIAAGIGIGGQGGNDLTWMMQNDDVQFVAICDAKKVRREAVKKIIDDKYGTTDCKMYMDFRELLAERSDIDLILTATGDRNHALIATHAMRAGKDVYSEKPGCICIAQGRIVADTAKRYGRVYQAGCQRISQGNFIIANELARLGRLGELKKAYVSMASFGDGTMKTAWSTTVEEEPPKEELWWDAFLGAAPWRPYDSSLTQGASSWGNVYDFHAGNIAEWGSHTFPQAQDAIGCRETSAIYYYYKDLLGLGMRMVFANGVEMFTSNQVGTCGVRYEGTEGWVQQAADLSFSSPALASDQKKILADYVERTGHPADHMRDILNCVKSRKNTIADAELMCRSMTTVHAATICTWLGRDLQWDPVKEEFVNDEQANRLRSRAMREPWVI